MFFNSPFPDAFGLEIGDLSIKLIQLQPAIANYKKHCFKVKEIRSMNLPSGLIVDGEIQQPELVRQKLLHLLGKTKDNKKYKPIRCPWVVASLPEVKTFLKLIKLETKPEDIAEADIVHQAKKHLPFETEEAYLDWQIINPKNKEDLSTQEVQVLLGAVPKVIADSYTYLLESVGLNPIALEIEAVAIARSLITVGKNYTGQARALLDLGATRSSLIIFDNNAIQFSTSINFSGELITTAIQQGLKIEHDRAEQLKIQNGVKYDAKNPKYLKIISNINNQLTDGLKTTMEFYKQHFPNHNIVDHITMCGGMANWKNLDNFISHKLKISSHPGRPWKNLLNKELLNKTKPEDLSLVVVIGLALRAVQKPV